MLLAMERLALADCTLIRPAGFDGGVEIVVAGPVPRAFPTHVSDGLGVCLKLGGTHAVTSEGKALVYPPDAVSVRAPGCVWSSEPAAVAFVSIDVAPALLPQDIGRRGMTFLREDGGLDVRAFARGLCASDPAVQQEALAMLVVALVERGAVGSAESLQDSAAMRQARERLAADLERPLTLGQLSTELGLNKFVLIRQFRRRFGTTPHRYRTLLRLERARELLARGHACAEIAYALGFSDQAHFSRAFRRVFGVAPNVYRRSVTGSRLATLDLS